MLSEPEPPVWALFLLVFPGLPVRIMLGRLSPLSRRFAPRCFCGNNRGAPPHRRTDAFGRGISIR